MSKVKDQAIIDSDTLRRIRRLLYNIQGSRKGIMGYAGSIYTAQLSVDFVDRLAEEVKAIENPDQD